MFVPNLTTVVQLSSECATFSSVFTIRKVFPFKCGQTFLDSDAHSLWPVKDITFSIPFIIMTLFNLAVNMIFGVIF